MTSANLQYATETWPNGLDSETIPGSMSNVLYYGDNLRVLRKWIDDESADLIYLDPPFNSKRMYNEIFKDSIAQGRVFKDYWDWDDAAESAYREVVGAGSGAPQATAALMESMRRILDKDKDTLAYLSMMAVRLIELHRVLKSTGSLFIQCDPTASHYLKVLLDTIFGHGRFINEITWKRTLPKGLMTRRLSNDHDVILAYAKGETWTWIETEMFDPYDLENIDEKTAQQYAKMDKDGRRYQLTSLLNPNLDRPNLTYEFLGVNRVWRWTKDRMQRAFDNGLVIQSSPGSVPRYKRYLDEQRGRPLGDVWVDIPPALGEEQLGYPTQKPVALLSRILRLASRPGDIVLDPFCGCGTTIEACERLGREWVGIDVAPQTVDIISKRMAKIGIDDLQIVGWPNDLDGATKLASDDKIGFQRWAVFMAGGRMPDGRKYKGGADGGIDGEIVFEDAGRKMRAIISVKGGGLGANDVRVLRNVVEDTRAQMGIFISMLEPTKAMRDVAREGGFVTDSNGREFRKIQLLMAEQLLLGKLPELPGMNVTPKSANPEPRKGDNLALPFGKNRPPAKAKEEREVAAKKRATDPPEAPKIKKSGRPGR